MARTEREARRARRRQEAETAASALPEKPEQVRYAVVCLYASSCITLIFLILCGEAQFYGAQREGLRLVAAAMAYGALSCLLDGLTGFVMSRGLSWTRYPVFCSAMASLAVAAVTISEVVVFSPSLFVCRTLALLLELCAVWLVTRPVSAAWFDSLAKS